VIEVSLCRCVRSMHGPLVARSGHRGDVEILPADPLAAAGLAVLAGAVASDAMADAVDAAALLGVEVEQFAGPPALVANDLARRVKGGELAEAETAQRDADGGDGPPKLAGDGGAGKALAPRPPRRMVVTPSTTRCRTARTRRPKVSVFTRLPCGVAR